MITRASWVEGPAGHVARIAAQAGMALGLGSGLGEGEGLGEGLAEGEGVGLGVGEGLEWATAGPLGEQAATASSTPMSTNPLLTGV